MRLAELYTVINQWWASKFMQTRISKPGTGHNTADTVRLADADGTDPDEAYPYTRLEQFGDVCCPPSDSHCIVFAKGEDGVVMSLAASTRPTSDKPGDRGLYCDVAGNLVYLHGSQSATPEQIDIVHKTGASIIIKADGSIKIDAVSGKDIQLNNGLLNVARKTDAVDATSDMAQWMAQVVSAIVGLLGVPPSPPVPATFAEIANGAANVKS